MLVTQRATARIVHVASIATDAIAATAYRLLANHHGCRGVFVNSAITKYFEV